MSKTKEKKESKKNWPPTSWFGWATFTYVLIILVGSYFLGFFDPDGDPISPSDWGSVLAGVSSPIAFLWLVYTALSQKEELELQRKELKDNNQTQEQQRQEMAKQVEVMQAQANVLQAQANASYAPIFVLDSKAEIDHTSTGRNADGDLESTVYIRLYITNYGAPVSNIRVQDSFGLPATIGGGQQSTNSYWPNGGGVNYILANFSLTDPSITFSISYQRLDAVRVANVYKLCDGATRIELIQTLTDGIPLTTSF